MNAQAAPLTPDAAGASPVMAQYFEAKARQPDALVFFRMGDFYELFFEDAQKAAAALGITLTARGLNPELFILARAGEEGAEVKLMRAGASKVISPYTIGAVRMAHAILRPSVVDFIELATASENLALQIEEIEVSERSPLVGKTLVTAEIRQSMGIIIVAIKQPDGHMLFNPPSQTVINAHSVLIILGERLAITRLEQVAQG